MYKVKKLIAVFAAVILSMGLMAIPALAIGTETVVVSNYLNVRSAGNTGAPVIDRLYCGAQVNVTSTVNGWDKISYNGKTGWVAGYLTTASRAQKVVSAAKSQIGVRYQYGAASAYNAFDCSGLTAYAYSKAGVTLQHSARLQANRGWWVSKNSLRPGDLVFFDTNGSGTINHVGIYVGNGNFVNAQSGAGVVKEGSLYTSYWSNSYYTARRIVS
jgi:cell wall-associated NlpC family hydrolase